FPTVHVLNFFIFVATVCIGRAFLKAWAADGSVGRDPRTRPSPLVPLGFGLLVVILLSAVPPSWVTPDLSVLAVTLLIALSVLRLRATGSWRAVCALGASCALGYWVKAVMFPLSISLIALLFVFPPPIIRARTKVVAAGMAWLVLSLPLIGLISAKLGRLSFGETGHLNYAWY